MPNVTGGISLANNLLANNALANLNKNQSSLSHLVGQLSSGLRVQTAADDPSGLGIATTLQAQVNGYDQASRNVQDASNAANVADGAIGTITDILQRVRTLAVTAASDVNSNNDRSNLQAEVSSLLAEVNRVAINTNFNGVQLLDGSHAGFQTGSIAFTTVNSNATLAGGTSLVTNTSITGTSTVPLDGTFEVQVVQINPTTIGTAITFFSSAAGTYNSLTVLSTSAATSYSANGVTVSIGAIATTDVGSTTFVKVSQYVASASNPTHPAFGFQSGAQQGAVISIGLNSVTTATLRLSNLNVAQTGSPGSAFLGSEDSIAQIDNAIQQVNIERASLGAAINRLQVDQQNDNTASVNLQASESGIRDLNVANATADYNKTQILVQIGTQVLAQSNINAQTVLGLFR